jgi:hypothetical protein
MFPYKDWNVFDFGTLADGTINACFWLSVVAGLSRMDANYVNFQGEVLDFLQGTEALKGIDLAVLKSGTNRLEGVDSLGKFSKKIARTCLWSQWIYVAGNELTKMGTSLWSVTAASRMLVFIFRLQSLGQQSQHT